MSTTEILAQLFDTVQARLAAGRPFSDPRAAWMGFEHLTTAAGHQIGLVYHSETKVISLKANTKTEAHQLLPVATRLGKGQYDISLTRPAFDEWAANFTSDVPVPVVEPDRFVNDLGFTDQQLSAAPTAEYMRIVAQAGRPEAPVAATFANAKVEQPVTPEAAPAVKTIWDCLTEALTRPGFSLKAGGEQLIWQSGKRAVSLHHRKSDGLLVLVARNGKPGPVSSRPVACNPGGMGWKLMNDGRRNYEAWQAVVSGKLAKAA